MKRKNKLLSIILMLVLLLGMLPVSVLAEETAGIMAAPAAYQGEVNILEILPLSQEEIDMNKPSVQAALVRKPANLASVDENILVDDTDTAVLELLTAIADSYANTADDWAAMAMAAYGKAGDVAGADIVKNARDIYAGDSITDKARSIITLTALGVDAANVYGGSEGVYLDFIARLGEKAPVQVMEAAFGLLAFDSGEYDDGGLTLTRQSCIDFLLNKKMTPADGQFAWAIAGSTPDPDATAMAVTALTPYYSGNAAVKTAVDGALKYLSEQQSNSGHYGNSNSTSMVIVALTALGQDPGARSGDFGKEGLGLIDGLLAFRTGSDQFGKDNNTTANPLSTEQGFRALVAYRGYLSSGKSVYNIYRFGAQTGDGTALTGEADPGIIPPDPGAPKNITVRVEDLYNGMTPMPQASVKLSGTHLDALKEALIANGNNPATDLTESSGFVSAILGISSGADTGWMYAINGEIPDTGLSETQIAEGDELVLFFINWYDSFYFTMFDRTTADIKAGEPLTLKLTGVNPWDVMGGGGVYAPLSGATVYACDAAGKRIGTEQITDADGNATLSLPTAGIYTVSAARPGVVNANELVPPLCSVTVASSTIPDPGDTMTVYFTLRGLSVSGNEETWINKKAVTNIAEGDTVSELIIKALEGSGYTQSGAGDGYIKSITTPGGFVLSEMHNGMENSGWLYKVNSQVPTVGMDSCGVQNGDHLLLYFTKDYTKDPDAGTISNGGSDTAKGKEKPAGTAEVKVNAVVKDGAAAARVDSEAIKDAIKEALEKLKKSSAADVVADIRVHVAGTAQTSSVQVEIKAEALNALTKEKDVQLTIESELGTFTFDAGTLAGIVKGIVDDSAVSFAVASVDTATLDNEIQKIIGDAPVFDLGITVGDTIIHQFNGTATVFLPFTPAEGADPQAMSVYYLDGDRNPVSMENVSYDAVRKGFVFTTTHFSLFYIGTIGSEWANPFADIKTGEWFYDAVAFVSQKGLFSGTSKTTFSPNQPMTRAMLVTALHNLESPSVTTGANNFTDVKDGAWYAKAVLWANTNNIVSGYGESHFGPDDPITREQIAAVLHGYANHKGYDTPATAHLNAYTDVARISPWAEEALGWANAKELITGRTATTLVPAGSATRAEVASILMRFVEGFVE